MTIICLDIETRSNLDQLPHLQDYKFSKIEPDARLRDPIKIEEDIKRKQQRIVEEAALSPMLGRISAITVCAGPGPSWACVEGGPVLSNPVKCFCNVDSEAEVLDQFLPWWATVPSNYRLVTFNGRRFDIPYLGFRLVANNINPVVKWPKPRDWERVIDVYELLGSAGSLNECLIAAGINPKIAEGSEAPYMDTTQLAAYATSEMISFVELVDRFRAAGMI